MEDRFPFFHFRFSLPSSQSTQLWCSHGSKTTGMERHGDGDHMSAAREQSSHTTLMLEHRGRTEEEDVRGTDRPKTFNFCSQSDADATIIRQTRCLTAKSLFVANTET